MQSLEQGERSTKYFFCLEKSNYKKKNIGKLVDDIGVELFDQFQISNQIVEFYKKLFRSTNPNTATMASYIESCDTPIFPVIYRRN